MKKLLSKPTKIQENQVLLNRSENLSELTDEQAESLSGGVVALTLIFLNPVTLKDNGKGALGLGLGIGGG